MRHFQRAKYEVQAFPLSGDWAYKVACEKFGNELVDTFPRFTRGARKGQLKGFLCYLQVSEGGWMSSALAGRRPGVLLPGSQDWHLAMATQYQDPHGHATVATWHPESGVGFIQSAADAHRMFRTYGTEPRYG